MPVETMNGNKVQEAVNAAIDRHGATRDELIPILNQVNQALGYLPVEALSEISQRLKEPRSSVLGVASFYHMLSTKPRGRHVIQFCESAPCHVVGGREVWEALQEELRLAPEETSPDGKWTLITTSCLGICGVGPVILIDEDVYGNLTADKVPDILARYS
ncbi:MAG: NADH-quinone oxidoreductase subunit NuoE [Bellilinea sp.]